MTIKHAAIMLWIIAAICFAYGRFAESQTTPTVFGKQSSIEFTHDGKDVAGGEETLLECEIGLTADTVADANAPGTLFLKRTKAPIAIGTNKVDISSLLGAGGSYRAWVRVSDAAKNWSQWAGSAKTVFDVSAPNVVTKIIITYTLTSGG